MRLGARSSRGSEAELTPIFTTQRDCHSAFFFAHLAGCAAAIFARLSTDTIPFFLRGALASGLAAEGRRVLAVQDRGKLTFELLNLLRDSKALFGASIEGVGL